jgi:hypothetical protein
MAAPDTETQAPPDYSGASPDLLAALKNLGGGGAPLDYGSLAQQLLQQPTLPQPDTTPVTRGLLSRLGEALGGGQVSGVMSPAQSETAGLRSLRDFGTSLIAGSGYYPGKPALGAFAEGFQGAERSQRGSEQQAAATLAAQQQYAAGQQEQYLKRLKTALPLLQMEAGSNIPNALLSANTPAVPGTAGGAGKPGGGGIALGMRQNNPLNLTFAGQPGAQPGQGNRFATFSDLPSGVAATADQLALYQTQHGINTVQDAVKRWVSDPKADLTSYTADVANALGVKPTDKIDLTDPAVQQKFILAAQPHESGGGGATLNPADVAKGVQLAAANRGQTVQGPQAPYKVATAGATVPGPPSGSTTAPAATPPPPGQTPPAASTAPPAPPTFADFQAKNLIPTTPEEQTTLDGLRRVQQQTATELQRAPQTGVDRVKVVQAAREAADNLANATRQIQDAHTAHQVTLYNADQQRQAQAGIETQRIQAAAAEAERQRQAAERIENIKAGITQRQKQADADVAAGSKLSETYDANAAHAGEIHTMLAQLGPNLQNLPQGFTAQLMAQHPGLVTTMANAGLVDPKTRDAVQLVTGLNNYLSVALRPLQSGSLRNVEMEKFQAALPNMLQSPAGQQKALAFLLNMTDRVQKEADYVRGQFHRQIPDPTNPNATLPAYNLPPDLFSKMDKELGPVLPHYSGGAPTDATAADYQKYVQSQKPGMPYYGYTRVVRNGQPVLDKNGRQVMREELQVAPEE